MTNRIWPIDAVNGGPAEPGRGLRQLQSPFLHGATPARPLGARSGVRPGTGTPATVSSTSWTIGAHAGVLDLEAAAEAGPYTYAIDAAVSGALTAANASNPRTDLLYVQMTDNSEDGTTPGQPGKVTVGYLAGVAGATAPVPATPPRALALARVNVPRAGAGAPTVSWVAPSTPAAGGVIEYPSRASLDADRPQPGTLGYVAPTGQLFMLATPSATSASPFWLHAAGKPDVGAITVQSVFTPDSARGLRVVAQGGRIYLEGAVRSSEATFDKDYGYVVGKLPVEFAPRTTKAYATDINRVLGYVMVRPNGELVVQSSVAFRGILDATVEGFSWPDARL